MSSYSYEEIHSYAREAAEDLGDFDLFAALAPESAQEPAQEPAQPALTVEGAAQFMLAGKAVFTLTSPKTGNRFTFQVSKKEVEGGRTLHFVKVLTGSDNTGDFTFLGTIFDRLTYRHGARSAIGASAPSAKAFAWTFDRLMSGLDLQGVQVHHEGRCGRCGRALTVPSSIESGFGPECAGKI